MRCVTRRMMEALSRQGITYAEVTLGAGVVQWLGFNFDTVWQAIRAAQKDAQKTYPAEVHWNLDAIRQLGPEHVMEIARLTARYVDDGVVSFGVGGDEVRGPATEFRDAYRYAKDAGLRLTAHAGETDGPDSVRNALDIGAERIGHGISGGGGSRSVAAIVGRTDSVLLGGLHHSVMCGPGRLLRSRRIPCGVWWMRA